jgi:hypothetical protein
MFRRILAPAAALAAALAAAPARAAEYNVLTVENRTLSVTSFTRGTMDTITFSRPGWMHANLPAEDIVEIAAVAPGRPTAAPLRVLLTNGDILAGAAGAAGADQVALESPGFGAVTLPFDQIDALLVASNQKFLPPSRPETPSADTLVRAGGDRITGLLKTVAADHVVFEVDGKPVTLPYRELAGIYLTRVKEPPAPPATLLTTLFARDGSIVTGVLEEITAAALNVRTLYPLAGGDSPRSLRLPVAEFVLLYFRNGRCVYLSDLTPSAVEERAIIEPVNTTPGDLLAAFPFPWRRDRTVDPDQVRPLTLRNRVYRKGLGVHSRCRLAYALGGRYKRFLATAGVDDSVAGKGPEGRGGSVVFEVWVDGRKVFNSGTVSTRDEARELDIPVEDAKELALVVDYGDDFDVLDHADWAGARLIR